MEPLPADVHAFIKQRNTCDHFRGEEPYDEERRVFLEKNLIEFCTGSDRQLAELKQKYFCKPPLKLDISS